MSLRDTIFGANDKVRAAVAIPEWGVTVHVRTCRSDEVVAFLEETRRRRRKTPDRVRFAERLLILVCEDEAGAALFTKDDEDSLAGRGMGALERLLRTACRLNGLSTDDAEDAGGN